MQYSKVVLKKIAVFVFCFLFLALSAEAKELRLLPLITYNTPDFVERTLVNPWGGMKKAAKKYLTQRGENDTFLNVAFQKSSVTVWSRLMDSRFQEIVKNVTPEMIYIRYRSPDMEGKAQIYFISTAGEQFIANCGLNPDGKWNTAMVRIRGWNRNSKVMNIRDLKGFQLLLFGSGTLDIAEIGVVLAAGDTAKTPVAPERILFSGDLENGEIRLDGRIERNEWKNSLFLPRLPLGTQDGNQTEIYLKPSESGLFLGAVCKKENISALRASFMKNSARIHEDEVVEFYFDCGKSRKHYQKIAVNANGYFGGLTSDLENCGIRTAARKNEKSWECELFVPWKFLTPSGRMPLVLGFNATRNCYDSDTVIRSGWSTLPYNDVKNFGTVLLGKADLRKETLKILKMEQGNYILEATAPQAGRTYAVFGSDPAGRPFRFRFDGSGESKQNTLSSFRFQPLKTGIYHVNFLIAEKDRITGLYEIELHESSIDDIRPLSVEEIALFPEPKHFRLGKDILDLRHYSSPVTEEARFGKLIALFNGELRKFYSFATGNGSRPILFGLVGSPSVEKALRKHRMEAEARKLKYDGFLLCADKEGILVGALNPTGLLFAVHALIDLVKMSTGDVAETPLLRSCRLVDYPDSPIRYHHLMRQSYGPENRYDPKCYAALMERYLIRYRYNGFLFELSNYYQWEHLSSFRKSIAWSKEDFMSIIDFLNQRFLPVMPSIQSLGHMNWWLFERPEFLKELREDGGKEVLCTGREDTYELLFKLYEEYCQLCSRNPETMPKYFHAHLDEIYWETEKTPPEKRCKLCAGKTKRQILLDHIIRLNEWINRKGMRMIMWSDMLSPMHSGLNEFKCSQILQSIPRNVVMAHWQPADLSNAPAWKKLGFENWKFLTGYTSIEQMEEAVAGYGFNNCTYNWWLTETRNPNHASYGIMAQILFADEAWNSSRKPGAWEKKLRRYGTHLLHNYSRKPLPHAGKGFFTISLPEAVSLPVTGNGRWFGGKTDENLDNMDFSSGKISGIPVKFTRKDGNVLSLFADGKSHSLKVGKHAATLLFLHGAHISQEARKTFFLRKNYHDPTFGPLIVRFQVRYEDGTVDFIPIRFGWNIAEWKIAPHRRGLLAKYPGDARSIWEGRTSAAEKLGYTENDIAIYQYEWVNPFPGKKIMELIMEPLSSSAEYALLALTARETTGKKDAGIPQAVLREELQHEK